MENKDLTFWLAPMEGVIDAPLREIYHQIGGVDRFVTEFIRVTSHLHSEAVIYRSFPELKKNPSGVREYDRMNIIPQLLGSDAQAMAENAAQLVALGARGIDLNFGCPAKTVNRHDGGAVLLKTPDRLFKIASSVRAAVPAQIPVSAKMRLGFDDPKNCLENSMALTQAGMNHLTVHCRTKTDMYRPPAFWEWIPRIKEVTRVPLVVNGEIWNLKDLERCRQETGCQQFMIGRGALRDPLIFHKLKNAIPESDILGWYWLEKFFHTAALQVGPAFAQARTKQWLRNMTSVSPHHFELFEELKIITNPDEFLKTLKARIRPAAEPQACLDLQGP
jgi:tRNA-dihydrouridine synthase C